jgi:DNA-binding response OmpR family regulator
MAGESILIVEDVPESLKFTAAVLRREGYRVSIASTAEQALSTLRFLQPDLILVDFMLPGMNGLDLTAQIKQNTRLEKSVVVALTAVSEPETELRARQAGCDGYLSKPIEARALLARVRDFLDFGKGTPGAFSPAAAMEASTGAGIPGLPNKELEELQESFLKAGKGVSRQLLASVETDFDAGKTSRTVHQWIGSAGLLGFPAVAERAREAGTVLRSPAPTPARLRGPLTRLARTFHNPFDTISDSAAQMLARVLGGKRVALIGLSGEAADLVCAPLEKAGARARLFEATQSPYDEAAGLCHLIVVHVRPENMISRWLVKDAPGLPALPTLFFGSPDDLIALAPQVQARANGLLVDGCLPEEAPMRLLAISQPRSPAASSVAEQPSLLRGSATGDLVIAYGDTAAHPLIKATMKEYGLRCRLASNGPEAILLLHTVRPAVAVVDVNLDGFEALAAIRSEAMPVRTIFITSPSQEDEVLRAFSLGADDYVVQPFSPLELIARMRKLLG